MKHQEIKQFFADNIRYKDWHFVINEKNGVTYMQVQFEAEDSFAPGKVELQHCRKWQLSEWMTPTELVRTAFLAVIQAERHETEESFLYKGQAIFNSHIAADKLVEVCQAGAYEHRAPIA